MLMAIVPPHEGQAMSVPSIRRRLRAETSLRSEIDVVHGGAESHRHGHDERGVEPRDGHLERARQQHETSGDELSERCELSEQRRIEEPPADGEVDDPRRRSTRCRPSKGSRR